MRSEIKSHNLPPKKDSLPLAKSQNLCQSTRYNFYSNEDRKCFILIIVEDEKNLKQRHAEH